MGIERRESPRFISHAQAVFETTGDRGELDDISVTGCMVQLTGPLMIKKDDLHRVRIYPEKDAALSPFTVETRVIWLRDQNSRCHIGLFIEKSPTGREFQRYVDYLSYYGQYRRAHID